MTPKNPSAVALGRRGGRSRSRAKVEAGRANMEKARAKRWPAELRKKPKR